MRYWVYKILVLCGLSASLQGQYRISGTVSDFANEPLKDIELFLIESGETTRTNSSGSFDFLNIAPGSYTLTAFGYGFKVFTTQVQCAQDLSLNIILEPLSEELSEVVVLQQRKKLFSLRSLKKVEGTAIYAGKKSEAVQLDLLTANLAANAPRQIYSQVVGLNIYENGDAGLQLNIGGRGLDPNRSANFNTRQNNYDISADVLGYPESYYTPPAEALEEIQVIRGAASLQYGTQFGGLINFKFRQPSQKSFEWISRQTMGSFGLKTSFNSLSGTVGKLGYYTLFNYKEGKGWRDYSDFSSRNIHTHLGYQLSSKTTVIAELTWFNYLAQQPGGLTDAQFYEDPYFTNRSRNWFDVDWQLYALRLQHEFSSQTRGSLQIFGLNASRSAIGIRENRVSQTDPMDNPRELLVDRFQNWGVEARLLHRYTALHENAVVLVGAKYYQTYNTQLQGPGSAVNTPDFRLFTDQFPNYQRQASFTFPNQNLALFAENIFAFSPKLTFTPGIRVEYIKTESAGTYRNVVLDLAGNLLLNEAIADNRTFERGFALLGVGLAYDFNPALEGYANLSQNYRSVTFSDIRVTNPSFVIDENISDEKGFTADLGIRGNFKNQWSFDVSVFGLRYNDRLGELLFVANDNRVKRRRGNIGDAFIYGFESLIDWNLKETFFQSNSALQLNWFSNGAWTQSEYVQSFDSSVVGKRVEFIPKINFKTGIQGGWKNLTGSLMLTYLSDQFTDATNAPQDVLDNQRGIEGSIPAYKVMDFSAAYRLGRWRLEAGVNNLLNETYFTRRATGYPGPGIIPAEPRSVYMTLQFKY